MITLRATEPDLMPAYMSEWSAGADLRAAHSCQMAPGETALVRTGLFIESYDRSTIGAMLPEGTIPELQIRARSSLALKHGITLANGIGTIDLDYPDEISVILINLGKHTFEVQRGERIAQMMLCMTLRIPNLAVGGIRTGGFGSTGRG